MAVWTFDPCRAPPTRSGAPASWRPTSSPPWAWASSRPRRGSWSPPRRREEKLLSLGFILRSYVAQGSLLALGCYATYFYMCWVLGAWRPGLLPSAMPPNVGGTEAQGAFPAYLQTLTVYFFPTVTTQIANVLCKRSWKTSLFPRGFLSPLRRRGILSALAVWRPPRYTLFGVVAFPLKLLLVALSRIGRLLERPEIAPLTARTARLLEGHHVC